MNGIVATLGLHYCRVSVFLLWDRGKVFTTYLVAVHNSDTECNVNPLPYLPH